MYKQVENDIQHVLESWKWNIVILVLKYMVKAWGIIICEITPFLKLLLQC